MIILRFRKWQLLHVLVLCVMWTARASACLIAQYLWGEEPKQTRALVSIGAARPSMLSGVEECDVIGRSAQGLFTPATNYRQKFGTNCHLTIRLLFFWMNANSAPVWTGLNSKAAKNSDVWLWGTFCPHFDLYVADCKLLLFRVSSSHGLRCSDLVAEALAVHAVLFTIDIAVTVITHVKRHPFWPKLQHQKWSTLHMGSSFVVCLSKENQISPLKK